MPQCNVYRAASDGELMLLTIYCFDLDRVCFFSCPEQRFYRQLLGMCGALRLGPDNLGSIYAPGWDCKVRVMTNFRAFVEPRGVEGMQTY